MAVIKRQEIQVLVRMWKKGKCKLVQPLWEIVQKSPPKLKTELANDTGILLQGIYPKETISLS